MVWETSESNPFLEYAEDQDALECLKIMQISSQRLREIIRASPDRGLHTEIRGSDWISYRRTVFLFHDIKRMNEIADEYYKDIK